MAAARAIAERSSPRRELREDYIIPSVFNRDVAPGGRRRRSPTRPRASRHRARPADEVGFAAGDAHARRPRQASRLGRRPVSAACRTRRMTRHRHGRHRPDRPPSGRRAAGARRRGDRALARPATRARGARRRRGRRAGTRRPSPRPPRRWPAATRSCTWPARPVAQRWSADGQAARSATAACRARATSSRGCAPAEPAPARARLRPRPSATTAPHGDEPLDEDAPPGDDFLAEVCVAWEREARRGRASSGVRVVRVRTGVVLDADGRRAGEDAAAVPARRRRPGRRRAPVHALDPRRRPRRHLPRRARRRALDAARSTPRRPSPSRTGDFSQGARARAAPPGPAPVPALALRAALRRDGRDRHRGPARGAASARSSSATRSRTPTSTRRCATRCARG